MMGNKSKHEQMVEAERRKIAVMERCHESEVAATKEALRIAKQSLRPATAADWLAYLSRRTKPCTHFYDYDFPGDFYVATENVLIPPACGALSISVIAPAHLQVAHMGGDVTHCSIFYMADPDAGGGWVPSYNDAQCQISDQ